MPYYDYVECHEDITDPEEYEFVEMCVPKGAPKKTYPAMRWLKDIINDPIPPPEWLIEDVLTTGSLVLVYGDWGSGKSFMVYDMLLKLAAGHSHWMGYRIPKAVTAAYHDEEMGGSLSNSRLLAAAKFLKLTDVPFAMCTPVGLTQGDVVPKLKMLWRKLGIDPQVVVIETARELMSGGDENKAGDVRSLMKSLRPLTHEGRCVIVIHHMNKPSMEHKSATRDRQSGSTDWQASVDISLAVSLIEETPLLSKVDLKKTRRGQLRDNLIHFTLVGDVAKDGILEVKLVNPPPKGRWKDHNPAKWMEDHPFATLREAQDAGVSQASWYRLRKSRT